MKHPVTGSQEDCNWGLIRKSQRTCTSVAFKNLAPQPTSSTPSTRMDLRWIYQSINPSFGLVCLQQVNLCLLQTPVFQFVWPHCASGTQTWVQRGWLTKLQIPRSFPFSEPMTFMPTRLQQTNGHPVDLVITYSYSNSEILNLRYPFSHHKRPPLALSFSCIRLPLLFLNLISSSLTLISLPDYMLSH